MMGRAVSGLITGTGLRPAPWTLHWTLGAARCASEFPNQRSAQPCRNYACCLPRSACLPWPHVPAEPADDIKPPAGYRHWFHVNTMIIDKGSPLFADLGGMHNVYVNSVGEAA